MLVLKSFFILLAICGAANGAKKVPWWQIKVAKSQGPNVCVVEEIPALGKKYHTECKFWPVRTVCGHETLIRYDCCEGYKQKNGEDGCTVVKPLKNVLETARDQGATKFVQYLESSGIAEELTRPGTFTLFAPIDSAFDDYYGAQVEMKIKSFLASGSNPVLRYHISNDKHPSNTFAGNNEIQSQYEDRMLRVSKYSTGMETVNCILISRKDQQATNGIVHMIDAPLDPTLFMDQDVAKVAVEDGRFYKLAQAMDRCAFMSRLKEPGKTFTLFAPSDEAFLKITPARFEKMISDRASCTALLENHVVPHVMCLPAITEEFHARTLTAGGKAELDCDQIGHKVNSKRLTGEMLLGNNGAVYMVDDLLIPDRARTLLELAETRALKTFVTLLKIAGVDDTFSNYGDYTLFAPTEEAFAEMDQALLDEAMRDTNMARKLCLYHGTQGRLLSNRIKHNQNVMSLDEENPLRLIVYRDNYGVENGVFQEKDIEGFNGVLHTINRVLLPARESAGDILRKSSGYSTFLETMETVLKTAPESVDLSRSEANSHYTFFVPNDEAFEQVNTDKLWKIQNDEQYRAKVIKNHIASTMMGAESFRANLTYELPTRQNALGVTCSQNGDIKVNQADVLEKDIMSTNGIIHVINRVLLPDEEENTRWREWRHPLFNNYNGEAYY